MAIKLKRCSWYNAFFCINAVLFGAFWTYIAIMKSGWATQLFGYYYLEAYPRRFLTIALAFQLVMLLFLLFFIKQMEVDRNSYTRKLSTEFAIAFFCLYTGFIYCLYSNERAFLFYIDDYYYEDVSYSFMYEQQAGYGQLIKMGIFSLVKYSIIASGYLWIITAITVKMKERRWLEDSLLVKLYRYYNRNRSGTLRKMFYRDILFTVLQLAIFLYEMLVSIRFISHDGATKYQYFAYLVAVPLLCETLLIVWRCKMVVRGRDICSLVNEIHKIKLGEKQIENSIPRNSILYESGEELRNISIHLYNSIQQKVKDEKLKVDLITNISHDLKTPLTSIVGYIDLLAAKDYLCSEDKHYVTELKKKAENLSDMINAVFELSKVSSGNMQMEISRLDLNRLVIQTIADLEDVIDSSGFDMKTVLSEGNLYFNGDGSRLYLVCQNLISNALKYSLAGSRIFIKTFAELGNVVFSIQNTSAYEIKFTEEEITGRFVRGDEARSDGGNGLGLAIAKTYTEACGGSFHIVIDGDMFKVIVQFPECDSSSEDVAC
ncbi:MAG TPA: HAMP domain-containing sensor histidine kinase [Lachnospiraceae bacterium]|nr:HAMP domain-containing sensor histidine kinase [Lachnospiraceae bacterium]